MSLLVLCLVSIFLEPKEVLPLSKEVWRFFVQETCAHDKLNKEFLFAQSIKREFYKDKIQTHPLISPAERESIMRFLVLRKDSTVPDRNTFRCFLRTRSVYATRRIPLLCCFDTPIKLGIFGYNLTITYTYSNDLIHVWDECKSFPLICIERSKQYAHFVSPAIQILGFITNPFHIKSIVEYR